MADLDAESEKVTVRCSSYSTYHTIPLLPSFAYYLLQGQVEDAVKKLATVKKLLDGLVRDVSTAGAKLNAVQIIVENLARELEV